MMCPPINRAVRCSFTTKGTRQPVTGGHVSNRRPPNAAVISTGRASTLFRWRGRWHGGMVPHRGTAGGTLREIHADEEKLGTELSGNCSVLGPAGTPRRQPLK